MQNINFFIVAPWKSEKLKKQSWLKRDKILADLDTMKHKMRQLKGQYGRYLSSCLIPNVATATNKYFLLLDTKIGTQYMLCKRYAM